MIDVYSNCKVENALANSDTERKQSKSQEEIQVNGAILERSNGTESWVFGYGSLVWKVDFQYEYRLMGYIEGFERRFYQNSIDHRGTPQKPGRVVTLVPSSNPDARVWGMAYKIAEDRKGEVMKHLDFREKNGYERHIVHFHPYPIDQQHGTGDGIDLIVYVADKENSSFAGPGQLDEIAEQIFNAVGPSGPNREYVYKLAEAMRTFFPGQKDEHLFELEKILMNRENNGENCSKNIEIQV